MAKIIWSVICVKGGKLQSFYVIISTSVLLPVASETQAVVEKEKVEEVAVKEEVLWTDEMVQDMFDCLDQVRDYLSQHHGQLVMI